MATQISIEDARTIGWDDGYQAALESGSADKPADGWDGWTINAVGCTEMCRILGEDPDESENGWSETMLAKLDAYAAGAQAGADAAIAQQQASN